MEYWKQTKEWEDLFKGIIIKAKDWPAIALCSNNVITPEQIDSAAGNHVFDDYFVFWGISENDGHKIRSVFQTNSVRYNQNFKKYIQELIDSAMDLKYSKGRLKV